MDRVIADYPSRELDGDLNICDYPGIAYQRDMSKSVPYDEAYFDKYVVYENSEIDRKLNQARLDLVHKVCGRTIVDIGIGSGRFLNAAADVGCRCFGYDINKKAEVWLRDRGIWLDIAKPFPTLHHQGGKTCWTLWDVLEHIPEPHLLLDRISVGQFLLTSIPIFEDLNRVRESKHFRPDEHYYYFTDEGFRRWMKSYGFLLVTTNTAETEAGREGIQSYAFVKREGL